MLVLSDQEPEQEYGTIREELHWRCCVGKVGAMEAHKVVAAIETAAKKNGIIKPDVYREIHALYHAIVEAIEGVTPGRYNWDQCCERWDYGFQSSGAIPMTHLKKGNGLQ
jgi:hut operon positive regulator